MHVTHSELRKLGNDLLWRLPVKVVPHVNVPHADAGPRDAGLAATHVRSRFDVFSGDCFHDRIVTPIRTNRQVEKRMNKRSEPLIDADER